MYRKDDFLIDPNVTFLNHGSFGSMPKVVFDEQVRFIRQMESQTTDFYMRKLYPLLKQASLRLAKFLNCAEENLVFIPNTTSGVNAVLLHYNFQPGDEVLMTDVEYMPLLTLWRFLEKKYGIKTKCISLDYPLTSNEDIVLKFEESITDNTRMIFFSHIVSSLACILPAKELTELGRKHGIRVLIDGAHGAAQLPLDFNYLDPDYYTSSLHKWVNIPRSGGFLYVKKEYQEEIVPNVVTWGYDSPEYFHEFSHFQAKFVWQGTRDFIPFLCLPKAIDYLEDIGLDEYRFYGHTIAKYALEQILELIDIPPLYYPDSDLFAMMSTCPLPPGEIEEFQELLWYKEKIEVVITQYLDRRFLRVSGNLHTHKEDIDHLLEALQKHL
jgi:isopenicillin-N epimerase